MSLLTLQQRGGGLGLSRGRRGSTYLIRRGHKVDGGVVAVVLLCEAEGELVVDEEEVCWESGDGGAKTGGGG